MNVVDVRLLELVAQLSPSLTSVMVNAILSYEPSFLSHYVCSIGHVMKIRRGQLSPWGLGLACYNRQPVVECQSVLMR